MDIVVKHLGNTDYATVFERMKTFTNSREDNTPDELWLTQHYPVFTQGQAGKAEHILNRSDIPVVQSDRGGQVTYHGPGQIVLYFLVDIKRRKIGVRQMVCLIEKTVIDALDNVGVAAVTKPDAPGVYIERDGCLEKISSLGLRVRNGRTYHGLALNVDMDLSPFKDINPCGYRGLKMTQLCDVMPAFQRGGSSMANFEQNLVDRAIHHLSAFPIMTGER